jgi:hypothetical protein
MSLVNFLDLREKIFLIEFCGGGLTPNDRVFLKEALKIKDPSGLST